MSSTFWTISDIPFSIFFQKWKRELEWDSQNYFYFSTLLAVRAELTRGDRLGHECKDLSQLSGGMYSDRIVWCATCGVRYLFSTLNDLFMFTHTWDMNASSSFSFFSIVSHRHIYTPEIESEEKKQRWEMTKKKKVIGIISRPLFTLFTNLCVLEFSNLTAVCGCDYFNRDKNDNSNWNIYIYFSYEIFTLSVKQFRIGDGLVVVWVCIYTTIKREMTHATHASHTLSTAYALYAQPQIIFILHLETTKNI